MFQQAFKNIDDVLWKEITAPHKKSSTKSQKLTPKAQRSSKP